MANEQSQKTPFDKQLDARGDWEKFKVSGEPEYGEKALSAAEQSGFSNDGKTNLLKNVPELSAAYDKGVSYSATDYAISKKENQLSHDHLDKYGPEIPPTVGKTYEGPIVYGTEKSLYQAAKVEHNEVLVRHDRKALQSTQTQTLEAANSVRVRYVTPEYAVATPIAKEITGPVKDMGREK